MVFEPFEHLGYCMHACTILLKDDLLPFELIKLYGLEEFILKYGNIKISIHVLLYPPGMANSLTRHTTPNHNRTPPMLNLAFDIPVSKAITWPSPYPLLSMRPKTFNNHLVRPNNTFLISFRPVLVEINPVSSYLLIP